MIRGGDRASARIIMSHTNSTDPIDQQLRGIVNTPARDAHNRRGRPPKFGRPSQVVALTLPAEVIRGLRKVHPDIAWAIVTLFEKRPDRALADAALPDAELVTIGERQSLIVVNRAVFKSLPGINIIPLSGDRAFLALDIGRGMTDLELAVIDRLDNPSIERRERLALKGLRAQLKAWRYDRSLRFHLRAIIVVERLHRASRPTRPGASAAADDYVARNTG
jgi:hypothetical protein